MSQATGRITIIAIPEGEAPLSVRRAWVGQVLPCDPIVGFPDFGGERGVLTHTLFKQNRYGFSVPQDEAIKLLQEVEPEAAAWWKNHGYPKKGECFGFSLREAQILSGVTYQTIIELTDDMQGDPFR